MTPFADPEEQKEYQRRWYREKYRKDKAFRELESDRKADWFQDKGKGNPTREETRIRLRKSETIKVGFTKDERKEIAALAKSRGKKIKGLIRELVLAEVAKGHANCND